MLENDSVDSAWDLFNQIFLSMVNNLAPYKQVRVKQRSSLWLNTDILTAIKQREEALQRFQKSHEQVDADTYTKMQKRSTEKD